MNDEKKKMCGISMILIVAGIVYLIWPIDIPGPIDDIAVNVLTISLAALINVLQRKASDTASAISANLQSKLDAKVISGEISGNTAMSIKNTIQSAEQTSQSIIKSSGDAAQQKITQKYINKKATSFD